MTPPQASTSTANYRDSKHPYSEDSDDDEDDGGQFQEAKSDLHHSSDDSEESSDDEQQAWHDPSELADLIEQATKCKVEGNAHFTTQRTQAAIEAYKEGLSILPAKKLPLKSKKNTPSGGDNGKGKGREEDPSDSSNDTAQGGGAIREIVDEEDEKAFVAEGQISEEEKQLSDLRCTLWNNLSACQLKLSLYKEAVESATEALKDNPDNVKAIQRRATANEKLGTWTSLTSALDDYNYLSKSSNTPKASLPAIRQAQRSLPQRIEERKGEETKEMMDKLKGLGNSFLGKFGMSTDNFQFVKNDETGGYSMNFVQKP